MKKYTNKTLPYNFLAERSVLSIIMNYSYTFEKVSNYLTEESFFLEEHKTIYKTLITIEKKNQKINLTTLITYLQDYNLLKKAGGFKNIINIYKNLQPITNLQDSIILLNEKTIRRKLIQLGENLIEWGFLTSNPLEEIFEEVEQNIFDISQEKIFNNTPTAAEILLDTFKELQMKNKKEEISGYASSFKDLDSILQGFQKTDVIVIAGRPSMGKTAFGLNIARNILLEYNIPIIFFSLEMSRQQLMYRLLSMQAFISGSKLRRGKMTKEEWKRLKNAADNIANLPIYIDDNPAISITEIKAKIRKILSYHNEIGIVIIDYLQLMKLNIKLQNRTQEIAHITRNLKSIAKEFNLPLIVLSQLSRNVESRLNKRPILSDLRESGCISKQKKIQKNFWNGKNFKNFKEKKFFFKGQKPAFQLIKNINITSNHKVLSSKGWLKIYEIRKNNNIFLKKYQSYKSFPITYNGSTYVFDIGIPDFHNFLDNNLILHNSIEQDADVVLMLYRDDYYKTKTFKHVSRSITDIIVAKHRNGPVGTASLIFDTNITRFFNIEDIA